MPYASNRRFFVRGLAVGVAWFGSMSSTSASPLFDVIPWSDQRPRVISFEEVLIQASVSETSAAELLASLGVDISPRAHAALVATGDPGIGGPFDVYADGDATGAAVFLVPHAVTPLSTTLEQIVGDAGEFVIEVETTVSLVSAVLVYAGQARPVLCAWVTQAPQPGDHRSWTSTLAGVSILGEAVSSSLATAFVTELAGSPTAQSMDQLPGSGITPPTPPPPTSMSPCCTCACFAHAAQDLTACLADYGTCVNAACASFRQGIATCLQNCPAFVLGPQVCMTMCLGQEVTSLGLALAGCLSALSACQITVMATTGACFIDCLLSGTLP